jgi:hypothetical protein
MLNMNLRNIVNAIGENKLEIRGGRIQPRGSRGGHIQPRGSRGGHIQPQGSRGKIYL